MISYFGALDDGDKRRGGKKAKWIEVQSANAVVLQEGDVSPLKPARLVFAIDGTYAFQVMLNTVKTGDWKFSDEPILRYPKSPQDL